MRTNNLSLGTLALAGAMAITGGVRATEPEQTVDSGLTINISAAQSPQLSGQDITQNGFRIEKDEWTVFGYQGSFDDQTSKFSAAGAGVALKTKLGTFSAGVLQSQFEDLRESGENTFYVLGYEKDRLEVSGGFGTNQTFVTSKYAINDQFALGGAYRENMGSLDASKPENFLSPYQQSTFFGLIPTQSDIFALHWDDTLTAATVSGEYQGRTEATVELSAGDIQRGKGTKPFTMLRASLSGGERAYGTVRVEASSTENQDAIHIAGRAGFIGKHVRGEFDLYGHGAASSFANIPQYYDAYGTGVQLEGKIRSVWAGVFGTIEEDVSNHRTNTQLGLSLRTDKHTFFAGVNELEDGRRNFLELHNGYFGGVKTKVLGLDVSAIIGDDGISPYGTIQVEVQR